MGQAIASEIIEKGLVHLAVKIENRIAEKTAMEIYKIEQREKNK